MSFVQALPRACNGFSVMLMRSVSMPMSGCRSNSNNNPIFPCLANSCYFKSVNAGTRGTCLANRHFSASNNSGSISNDNTSTNNNNVNNTSNNSNNNSSNSSSNSNSNSNNNRSNNSTSCNNKNNNNNNNNNNNSNHNNNNNSNSNHINNNSNHDNHNNNNSHSHNSNIYSHNHSNNSHNINSSSNNKNYSSSDSYNTDTSGTNSSNSNKDHKSNLDRKKTEASRKLGSSSSASAHNKHGNNIWNRLGKDREKDRDNDTAKDGKVIKSAPAPVYTHEAERLYKEDPNQKNQWKSTSVFQIHGRVHDADKELLKDSETKGFPAINALSLAGKDIIFPDFIDSEAKLVGLSFKKYGQDACKSWLHPFTQNFKDIPDRVKVGELLINEFQILSGLQFMFVSGAKSTVPESRWLTSAVKVGGVAGVAVPLLLPNIYTGYMFLLDRNNMIRWRASGYATLDELDVLINVTNTMLLAEEAEIESSQDTKF